MSAVSWTSIPITTSPWSRYRAARSRRIGVSDWHGGHHDAQKLIQTAFPRRSASRSGRPLRSWSGTVDRCGWLTCEGRPRSEEHTSELQSPYELACRHLLVKKIDIMDITF